MRPHLSAVLVATLFAAGCGEVSPKGGSPTPAPADTPTAAPSASPAPAAAPLATTAVKPGELRTFGDWTVGCDNIGLCQMASLAADNAVPEGVTMALLRQPGGGGAVDLSFDAVGDEPAVAPVAVTIDGRRLPLGTLNGSSAMAVARAMAEGRSLTVLERGGRVRARLSLAGASAALRWIDAQQGRAGTVTALVARGDRPVAAVPEARPAPVIRAAIPTAAATPPTEAKLADMRRRAGCDAQAAAGTYGAPEHHALGHGATLVMLPCSTGAYNLSSTLFVIRDGVVVPAETDAPVGFDASPAAGTDRLASVVNGAWKDGELTSYAKGRGLGDCGVHQTFVWDGSRLRLTEQSEMGECRGNPNYITIWRAQVVRG